MKSFNYEQQNKQNRKLEKQVNHLQSFIGMPMWNGHNPSLSEIREYDRRLLEKQALCLEPKRRSLLRYLFDGLKSYTLKALRPILKTANKTKTIKLGIVKPIKTGNECCG